jgi:hypothetical protein
MDVKTNNILDFVCSVCRSHTPVCHDFSLDYYQSTLVQIPLIEHKLLIICPIDVVYVWPFLVFVIISAFVWQYTRFNYIYRNTFISTNICLQTYIMWLLLFKEQLIVFFLEFFSIFFPFSYCIFCPSSLYDFWYLQTFLNTKRVNGDKVNMWNRKKSYNIIQ